MMSRAPWIIFAVAAVFLMDLSLAFNHVPAQEWADYKLRFNKDYTNSDVSEPFAQYYYAYNKRMIDNHNRRFDRGDATFKLAVNENTDRRFMHFSAGFPAVTFTGPSFNTTPPVVQAAAPSYDPINDFGFMPNIENQGRFCNSGWAYSVCKAVEMLQAQQTGNMTPLPLSAQNLIDCAGRSIACTRQVPQAALDYLTQFNMDLHMASDYPNNNTLREQGMCTPQGDLVTNVGAYARLRDGDNEALMSYVSNGYGIVVEIVPNYFEFMHYSEGIYQQPLPLRRGSHFVLLIGYGTDPVTGINYWLVQNSFGSSWGENGLMRIQRTTVQNIFRNAIFPTELA